MPEMILDSSCLIALGNIGRLGLLEGLYRRISITPEVAAEYGEPLERWMVVRAVSDRNCLRILSGGCLILARRA